MMRVLYAYRYGILGGVCTQIINRMPFLRDAGIDVHLLFARDHGISTTLDGFEQVYFDAKPSAVRTLAAQKQIDIVVVVDTGEYLTAMTPAPPGVRVVTEVHTTVEIGLRYLHERSWTTDGFVVPSTFSQQMLRDRFGVDPQHVTVVPNCLDARLFRPIATSPHPTRPVLLWVGKLDDHKNWKGFLDIGAQVVRKGSDVELWMLGGETALTEVVDEMLATVARKGLMTRFRWFDRTEYHAMPKVYSAVAASGGCKVVTSKRESFGMSVLEAMLCGCPVVSCPAGAIPELAPGKSYLSIYPKGATVRAASMVCKVLADPQPYRDALLQDLPALRQCYSLETVGEQYVAFLNRLLSSSGRDAHL